MLCLALSFAAASPAAAGLRCDAPGNLLRWPEERPVWELCWLYPAESSGPAGSGVELRDVRYRGVTVLARAQLPVTWAELAGDVPGCSGRCFRTWTWQTSPFGVRGEVVPGYYEIDLAAAPGSGEHAAADGLLTVCDRHAGAAPGECPWGEAAACGEGVAVERWSDGFRLTTQLAAGWFRYAMRWTFHRDGTIEPRLGFARGSTVCAEAPTTDAAVWRLDLDLAGKFNRVRADGEDPGTASWRVLAARSDLGYRLRSGAGDLDARWWVTPLVADALTDAGRSCAFDPEGLPSDPPAEDGANGEDEAASEAHSEKASETDSETASEATGEAAATSAPRRVGDVVLWYRAAASGAGAAGCRWVGPTLEPIGRWPPAPGPELFSDGFESGGLEAWTAVDSTRPVPRPAPRSSARPPR